MTKVYAAQSKVVILSKPPFETPPAAAPQGKLGCIEGRNLA